MFYLLLKSKNPLPIQDIKKKILSIENIFTVKSINSIPKLFNLLKNMGLLVCLNTNHHIVTFQSQYNSYLRFCYTIIGLFSINLHAQQLWMYNNKNKNPDQPIIDQCLIRTSKIISTIHQYNEENLDLFIKLWHSISELVNKFLDTYIKNLELQVKCKILLMSKIMQQQIIFCMQIMNENGAISSHQLLYEKIRLQHTKDALLIKTYELHDSNNMKRILHMKDGFNFILNIGQLPIFHIMSNKIANNFGLKKISNKLYFNADLLNELSHIRQKQSHWLNIVDINIQLGYNAYHQYIKKDKFFTDPQLNLEFIISPIDVIKCIYDPYKNIYIKSAIFYTLKNKKNIQSLKESIKDTDTYYTTLIGHKKTIIDAISSDEYQYQVGLVDKLKVLKSFEILIDTVGKLVELKLKKNQYQLKLYHNNLTLYILLVLMKKIKI